jgi:hypothetical protein
MVASYMMVWKQFLEVEEVGKDVGEEVVVDLVVLLIETHPRYPTAEGNSL